MPTETKMTFLPSEMASEIRAFASMITVSTPLSAADEGKVLENDQLVEQTALTINANGTYDTTVYNSVTVNVPDDSLILTAEDENKVVSNGALVVQTSSTFTRNGEYDTTLFSEITINVPDEGLILSAADEGKVIQNGVPVAQASSTFTANGTYDTTLFGEVTVNVPSDAVGFSSEDEGKIALYGELYSPISTLNTFENGEYDTSFYKQIYVGVPDYSSGRISPTPADEGKLFEYSGYELRSQLDYADSAHSLFWLTENSVYNTARIGRITVNVQAETTLTPFSIVDLFAKSYNAIDDINGIISKIHTDIVYVTHTYSAPLPGSSATGPYIEEAWRSPFSNQRQLLKVNFPNCLEIGSGAFFGCEKLAIAHFQKCKIIGSSAFIDCQKIVDISFPDCEIICEGAFRKFWGTGCSYLKVASFPKCKSIGTCAFSGCSRLTSVYLPECTSIGESAFLACNSLTEISLPKCTFIGNAAFLSCYSLKRFYLTASSVVSIGAPSDGDDGYPYVGATSDTWIYVPASLKADYISHSIWSAFASHIVGI